jgi:hypothetical protein
MTDSVHGAAYNGVPATALPVSGWQKSRRSSPHGNCVELAGLPDGGIAIRNSRDPHGPALVYTPAEIEAFFAGVRAGEFNHLIGS